MYNYDFNKEILRDIVNTDTLPADIIKILNDGKITTFYNTSRSIDAIPKIELALLFADGAKKIYTICDFGYCIKADYIEIRPFKDRKGRNEEIYRLYHQHKLSQVFLGNFFNISQPSVSLIVNNKTVTKK